MMIHVVIAIFCAILALSDGEEIPASATKRTIQSAVNWKNVYHDQSSTHYSTWFGGKVVRRSGPQIGLISGIVCQTRYCQKMRLISVHRGAHSLLQNYLSNWTNLSTTKLKESSHCPSSMIVNEVLCQDRYCNVLRFQCSSLHHDFRIDSTDVRSLSWIASKPSKIQCPNGYYLWGIASRRNYGTRRVIHCVRVESRIPEPVPTWKTYTHRSGETVPSRWFNEIGLNGYSLTMAAPIAGFKCSGKDCSLKQLLTIQKNDELVLQDAEHWTSWAGRLLHPIRWLLITLKIAPQTVWQVYCPSNMLVIGMQCRFENCEGIRLRCGLPGRGFRIDRSKYGEVELAHEQGQVLCPDGSYISGLRKPLKGEPISAKVLMFVSCTRLEYIPDIPRQLENFPQFDFSSLNDFTVSEDPTPDYLITWAARSWMRKVDDNRMLNNLSIPGTHDTAMIGRNIPGCQTQAWTINSQLQAGMRYLDLRLYVETYPFANLLIPPPPQLRLVHGGFGYIDTCFSNLYFDQVLKIIDNFLQENPFETILMRVKEERGDSPLFAGAWTSSIKPYIHIFAKELSSLPRLKDVRGKVVVLRNTPMITGVGLAWGKPLMNIQDFYEMNSTSVSGKKRLIDSSLINAESSKDLVANHLSATAVTKKRPFGKGPLTYAKIFNPYAFDKLQGFTGPRSFGIIIMDFPGEGLIYNVLRSNF